MAAIRLDSPQALTFDGTHIWVALGSSRTQIAKLDLAGSVLFTGQVQSSASSSSLLYDGDGVWITGRAPYNTATKVRLSNGTGVNKVPVGSNPVGMAFDGTHLWVAAGDGTVTKIKTADGSVLGTYRPMNVQPITAIVFDGTDRLGGTSIWITLRDAVFRLSPVDGSVQAGVFLGLFLQTELEIAGLLFDGESLWVSDRTGGRVINLAFHPSGQAIDFAETYVVGSAPSALIFDGLQVWVANTGDGTVTRLPIAAR